MSARPPLTQDPAVLKELLKTMEQAYVTGHEFATQGAGAPRQNADPGYWSDGRRPLRGVPPTQLRLTLGVVMGAPAVGTRHSIRAHDRMLLSSML
jgi:hypothetical protein